MKRVTIMILLALPVNNTPNEKAGADTNNTTTTALRTLSICKTIVSEIDAVRHE